MSMSLYKHKSLRNRSCASNKCDNPAKKRVLLPLGFSAYFCGKCADDLIRNNLGVEELPSDSPAGQDVDIASELNGREKGAR